MDFIRGLDRKYYLRLCRAYARHFVKDKPADRLYGLMCRFYFLRVHGYWPDFRKPRSFSEKLWHRMLYDRNPLWAALSDKSLRLEFVGSKVESQHVIPLLWRGDNPDEIPFDALPAKFVIKATHGSGYNIIVHDKNQADREKIRTQLKAWLRENYCTDRFAGMEWGYRNIRPTVLVEKFLESDNGVPADYKFLCFSGRAEFVQVDHGRFTESHYQTYLDRDFNPLGFDWGETASPTRPDCPENYPEMRDLAERLAQGFDFMRVDLYSVAGRIYVGELTCYPAAGSVRITPKRYDYLLGEKWRWNYALLFAWHLATLTDLADWIPSGTYS